MHAEPDRSTLAGSLPEARDPVAAFELLDRQRACKALHRAIEILCEPSLIEPGAAVTELRVLLAYAGILVALGIVLAEYVMED